MPQNIDGLITPKVNPEVWGKIKTETRSRDVRLQKAQVLTALVMLGEKIVSAQKDNKNIDLHASLKLTLNAVALISSGNKEISFRRREFIRPDLNKSYRELCSNNTPITDLLFGDDLPKVVKDINETNRMASRFSYNSQRGNQRGGYRNQNQSRDNGYNGYKKQQYGSKNGNNSLFWQGEEGWGLQQPTVSTLVTSTITEVSWLPFLDNLKKVLYEEINEFKAGRIAKFASEWSKITSDKFILNLVRNGIFY